MLLLHFKDLLLELPYPLVVLINNLDLTHNLLLKALNLQLSQLILVEKDLVNRTVILGAYRVVNMLLASAEVSHLLESFFGGFVEALKGSRR